MEEPEKESFFEESRDYLNTQIALFKLETIEKLSLIIQSILLVLLTILLVGGAVFYLSLGFIWWSQSIFDGLLPGILLVSGFYLLLLLLFFLFRKQWIINPLIKLFSRLFFAPSNTQNDDEE